MRKLSFLFLITLFTTTVMSAQKEMSKQDSISYSVGVMLANTLKQQGLSEVDLDVVMSGLKDAVSDQAKIDKGAAANMLDQFVRERQERMVQENLEKGQAFLAENAKKDSVKVLESGLQYQVLREGQGVVPTSSDRVEVHYHGTLMDGTVFDSSVDRGQPASFGVTQVIKGWVEALQMMPTGSKWRLFIPADLAYGTRETGGIPPNSVLIFDVELLDIK
ncbi:MAG: FKBP-type peptidyl-prolyl cis-trans isomerase [Bacteroidota bacterium]